MASPVDTTVKWARSDMPGAPLLTRAAGSMAALLDALLVDGWGLQSATSVVVASGVATATFPSDHAAALHSVVEVAGATGAWSDINGEQKITSATSNTLQWATALPDGTATGSITVKMAGGGWTRPFTGTNLRAYKSASPQGHGQYLRVNDAGTDNARVIGYETMTAISTGTGPFPTSAQVNGGYYWWKSGYGDNTPVNWLFATDGRMFWLAVEAAGTAYPGVKIYGFGDLIPEAPAGDPYATLLVGDQYASDNLSAFYYMGRNDLVDNQCATPRRYSGVGTCVRGCLVAQAHYYSWPAWPNPITGGMSFAQIDYRDASGEAFTRAVAPGVRMGLAIGVESFLPPRSILSAGARDYAVVLSGPTNILETTGLVPQVFDITGPWR
jgi:hypothetical protein